MTLLAYFFLELGWPSVWGIRRFYNNIYMVPTQHN